MSLTDVYKANLVAVFDRHAVGGDSVDVKIKTFNAVTGLLDASPDSDLLQMGAVSVRRTKAVLVQYAGISNLIFGEGGDYNIGDDISINDEVWSLVSILASPDNNMWQFNLIWPT